MAASFNPKEGKGKGKDKKSKDKGPKSDAVCSNKICSKISHTSGQCFKKGGGREGQAPEWWKKMKAKKDKKSGANVAETKSDNEPEDYAMLATTDDQLALECTSDFRSEAHAISNVCGIIIDSSASHHFSPDRSKFLNYKEFVNQEPIRAADGCTC